MHQFGWHLDMGAQVRAAGGVHFQVWAPNAQRVDVELHQAGGLSHHALQAQSQGIFNALVPEASAGDRYRYRLDGQAAYPDPYSRKQPDGVHGPSEVVATDFAWQDDGWPGITMDNLLIYELHVGAFTAQGTFEGVISQLDELGRLGITAIELMPLAEFPGQRNWGYDGVYLYAPSQSYGGVNGLKEMVNAAHQRGLAVLLDVVYNHLGPSGNYLRAYAHNYFTDRYSTPWGEAINYDGEDSHWVRHFAIQNACYWLNEYHIDGLRLDATHAIYDSSPKSVLQELAETARASLGPSRSVVIIAENENNDIRLVQPVAEGGYGLDGIWADDFHHATRALLTGENDGYYADYSGQTAELAYTLKNGFLYQGQLSKHKGRARGVKVGDETADKFIFCIQNHDQIGNRAFGERLNQQIDRALYHVASALLLLAPETPLLFMGQEFAASSPFLYFTDHDPDLGRLVTLGRREEFRKFRAFSDPQQREKIPDPQAQTTFQKSKLDFSERQAHASTYQLYKDLIALRRTDPVLRTGSREQMTSKALSETLIAIHRWSEQVQEQGQERKHRLALFNFGPATSITINDDTIADGISPGHWQVLFSSAAEKYGGDETEPRFEDQQGTLSMTLPPRTVVILAADAAPGE